MSEQKKKEDLRFIKTRNAIQSAFREMICEMDYKDITIKELTAISEQFPAYHLPANLVQRKTHVG